MAVRTRMSPGVEWNEVDKSSYSPSNAGTTVYLKGFSSQGEPYKPVRISTRNAFKQMFGAPQDEAERYFYAGACEVLDKNGNLVCARLPYDNASFNKVVGVKYTVSFDYVKYPLIEHDTIGDIYNNTISVYNAIGKDPGQITTINGLMDAIDALYDEGDQLDDYSSMTIKDMSNRLIDFIIEHKSRYELMPLVSAVDPSIKQATYVNGGYTPSLYDLSTIDQLRTNEKRVPANTFLVVDMTGATYGKVVEDNRKGMKRECIGIIPVVTTAVNALYAQSYISASLSEVNRLQPLCGSKLKTLVATDNNNQVLSIDGNTMENAGLLSSDLAPLIATDSYFHEYKSIDVNVLSTDPMMDLSIQKYLSSDLSSFTGSKTFLPNESKAIEAILSVAKHFNAPQRAFSISADSSNTSCYIVSASMMPWTLEKDDFWTSQTSAVLTANHYTKTGLCAMFGWHGVGMDDKVPHTIALDAAQFFPPIQSAPGGKGLDRSHLKDIGVVVYKAFLDPSVGNKVNVEPVEAFAGSLFKDDKDSNTGVTKFIDTIINSQSQYINFFSNCFVQPSAKKYYKDECDILVAPPAEGACLGLYSPMTKKDISISKSIFDGMSKCFEKVSDINALEIDVVPDAGVSNIASCIKAIFGEKGPYELDLTDDLGNSLLKMWTCKQSSQPCVQAWADVVLKHDEFCKSIRKDCMFTTECPRPLVLQGQRKIVRPSKPTNTIETCILPCIPAICGINTSYGAGYADWFQVEDDTTGEFFWCPPSIKATGCYVNTDLNFDYWLAPAGLNRGVVDAVDLAFSPNDQQASIFYDRSWNYAVMHANDGIVLEGQKTFQTEPTALDRVNVRRTMLKLERQVYKALRHFAYENNTQRVRQKVVDTLEPILKACWQSGNGGIQRYKIVCDESNNGKNAIDNNELRIAIAVIPTKCAEFISVQWLIGSQGISWEELF